MRPRPTLPRAYRSTGTIRRRHHPFAAMAALLACVAALIAAPGSASASNGPSVAMLAEWSHQVLIMMNQERHRHGVLGVHPHLYLERSAQAHDYYMAHFNTMSHRLPGEASLGTRIAATGYRPWCALAENVGWNSDVSLRGALTLQAMMYGEKPPGETGHRAILLSRAYYDVGITLIYDAAHRKLWLTEDFGHRC